MPNASNIRPAAALLLVTLAGCGSSPSPSLDRPQPGDPASDRRINVTQQARSSDIAIDFEGRAIGWDELTPLLAEAAGASAIEDVVLERLVTRALLERGLAITQADVARERDLLIQELRSGLGETAGQAFVRLRARRGLGEVRMARLLERNAGLRALVAPDITITDAEIRTAYDIAHGPRIEARLIVVPSLPEASAIRDRVATAPNPAVAFATEAVERSIDPSGVRGGLVDPISTADPRWPGSIRQRAGTLGVAEVSEPLAIDGGFALLFKAGATPADGVPYGSVAPDLERRLRLARERVAMESLAERLLADARFEILDPALAWSWSQRVGQR